MLGADFTKPFVSLTGKALRHLEEHEPLVKRPRQFTGRAKHFFVLILMLGMGLSSVLAQSSYLQAFGDFKANDIPGSNNFSTFDIHGDFLYAGTANAILCFDLESGEEIESYPMPTGYTAFGSFITVSPDGSSFYAGYTTTNNLDDRIYRIDTETGEWTLLAHFTANFDLEFLGDNFLVSGLNSNNWGDPNGIFLLDISGNDNHRKIIETGGNPAGITMTSAGSLIYGTSFFGEPNALYRWNTTDIQEVISNPDAEALIITDAEKLSDLPAGSYDCTCDAEDQVVFTFNDFASVKIVAVWNGTAGDGYNLDTIAMATDASVWLLMVKTRGSINANEVGNQVFTLSYGSPLAEIHADYKPVLIADIPNFQGFLSDPNLIYDLSPHFDDPDDPNNFSFEIIGNSSPDVAQVSIDGSLLVIDFVDAGQSNIILKVISAEQSVNTKFVVGVYPQIEGDFEVSDFEDLNLAANSFWNGSDLGGGFSSGLASFPNNYNPDWASWSGWAYSNMANDTTPGFLNQYSAITATGFEPDISQGSTYGVAFVPSDFASGENIPISLYFTDNQAHSVEGFYVTNSTYAALSMEYGDDFTDAFGGESGDEPDFFKLSVFAYHNGNPTDTLDFYLADYRFADNSKDYIIKTWQWIELSSLGLVDSLKFDLSSSDVGIFGMNTPAYFCMDQMYVSPDGVAVDEIIPDDFTFQIFPNPTSNHIQINTNTGLQSTISIFNFAGQKILEKANYRSGEIIPLAQIKRGVYLIQIQNKNFTRSQTLIKQ